MATKTDTSATTLHLSRTFSAPREKVFSAWTQPEALKRWYAPADDFATPVAEVDLRVGGRYRIEMKDPSGEIHTVIGTYKEIAPPERLVFTFAWEGNKGCGGVDLGDVVETLVTLLFEARGETTVLTITHERFPNSETRDRHGMGWTGCLDRLAKAL